MQLHRKYFVTGLLICIGTSSAYGVTINRNRTVDVNSSLLESPYFTESADGAVTPTPTTPTGNNTWAPASPTKAGAVTSTSPRGVFAIPGSATAKGTDTFLGTADDWNDGNGIPTGLTLNFKAQFTISVGPNSPPDSYLTFTGNLGNPPNNDFGNGLGMVQGLGGVGAFEGTEEFAFSAFTISDVGFSGTNPAGFTVGTPTVSTLSTRAFRSAGFTSASEGALLTSGSDTIGYGTQAGSIASNVVIGNNFNGTFTPQAGPFTLKMTAGNMALKGISFAYTTSFDITPIVNGDFNGDTLVDGADFLIWQQNYPIATDATRAQGNGNPLFDGTVDSYDLSVWSTQYGSTQPPSTVTVAAIPEPSALLLALGASIAAGVRRRASRTNRR